MTQEPVRFGEADPSLCDREPIHVPGSIQPHGVLLAVNRRDLTIEQWAGDSVALLAVEPGGVLHSPVAALFDDDAVELLRQRLCGDQRLVAPSVLLDIRSRQGAALLDLTIHAQGDVAIVEVEAARRPPGGVGTPLNQLKDMIIAVQSAGSVGDYLRAAAVAVRAGTGFDRVMVYQFLEDGSGVVVAEDKVDELESFLGLHYPASDIPKQARELYRRSWLRLIPDVDYRPAALSPEVDPLTGQPLDMSLCVLRSVSPIHLQYLRNMGVAASMSISIRRKGELWGLIACHHSSPHFLSVVQRISGELFGKVFSLQLDARVDAEASGRRIAAREVLDELNRRARSSRPFAPELTSGSTLLDLVSASGAAVLVDDEIHVTGPAPPAEFIGQLTNWLDGTAGPIYETHHLVGAFPAAEPFADTASGLLALSLSSEPRIRVLWFRPELIRTVTWAGDPRKPVERGGAGVRLSPRASFEAWREDMRRRSAPWSEIELEAARALKLILLEAVLEQSVRREREAADAQKELLLGELDHRVKNTLANIRALMKQTARGKTSLEEYVTALDGRLRAMARSFDLLRASRWEGATLRSLIEEETDPFRNVAATNISLSGDDIRLTPKAALPISLVIHELTTNAAKYGALSRPEGSVAVTWRITPEPRRLALEWRERGGPQVTAPKREGFGTKVIERSLWGLNGAAEVSFPAEGLACEMSIPLENVIAP